MEGAKDEALNLTSLAQVNGGVQLVQVASAAVLAGFAVDYLVGVLILQVQNGVTLLPIALAQVIDDVVGSITAHDLQAVLKHPQVTDDNGAAVVCVIVLDRQHGDQLRSYTGRIA